MANNRNNKIFSCDFETANNEELNNNKTWVWLACSYDIIEDKIVGTYNSIDEFFTEFVFNNIGSTLYFHNLKFDGNFILNYLIRKGFTPNELTKNKNNTFKSVIDLFGNFFMIEIFLRYNKSQRRWDKITIIDSLKIIPLSEDKISKSFNLEVKKGAIDYTKYRDTNYKATKEEIEYIEDDVRINGKALKYFLDNGFLNGITIGQIAFKEFKNTCPKWRSIFPLIDMETEEFLRNAYRGGWCFVNPKFQGQIVHDGCSYDANSLYPSIMLLKDLPYGEPLYFKGEPKLNNLYKLYIAKVVIEFEIKEDHFPTIQIRNSAEYFSSEYLYSTDKPIEITLTSVDIELIRRQYNCEITFIEGYMFRSVNGIFNDYIEKFSKMKIENDKNEGLRQIAKLFLNNLYGQFAKNPHRCSKIPYIDLDGKLAYTLSEPQLIKPIYVAVACFITSYGRFETITKAQANKDIFLYADTDSVHLLNRKEFPIKDIKEHPTSFGYWKKEYDFKRGKYLHAKCYIEELENKTLVKIAGLPSSVKDTIKIEQLNYGAEFKGKLSSKSVNGGVILANTTFKIKEKKIK